LVLAPHHAFCALTISGSLKTPCPMQQRSGFKTNNMASPPYSRADMVIQINNISSAAPLLSYSFNKKIALFLAAVYKIAKNWFSSE
jgi:hypothetical protein